MQQAAGVALFPEQHVVERNDQFVMIVPARQGEASVDDYGQTLYPEAIVARMLQENKPINTLGPRADLGEEEPARAPVHQVQAPAAVGREGGSALNFQPSASAMDRSVSVRDGALAQQQGGLLSPEAVEARRSGLQRLWREEYRGSTKDLLTDVYHVYGHPPMPTTMEEGPRSVTAAAATPGAGGQDAARGRVSILICPYMVITAS